MYECMSGVVCMSVYEWCSVLVCVYLRYRVCVCVSEIVCVCMSECVCVRERDSLRD